MQSTNLSNIAGSLRRERRKTALLGVLLVALVVIGGRKIFGGGDPADAAAGVTIPLEAENGSDAGRDAAAAAGIGRSAALVAEWRRQPPPLLRRNLFASAQPAEKPAPITALPEDPRADTRADAGLFWRQLERTLLWQAEQEEFRRKAVAAVIKDAETVQVSSIVTGSDPRALVGDRLVRIGDVIELPGGGALRVWAIERRAIGVEREGVRVRVGLGRGQVEVVGSS